MAIRFFVNNNQVPLPQVEIKTLLPYLVDCCHDFNLNYSDKINFQNENEIEISIKTGNSALISIGLESEMAYLPKYITIEEGETLSNDQKRFLNLLKAELASRVQLLGIHGVLSENIEAFIKIEPYAIDNDQEEFVIVEQQQNPVPRVR